jgi:hypothetical protein
MSYQTRNLGTYSDEFLHDALVSLETPIERAERLEIMAHNMSSMIVASWNDEPHHLLRGLKAAPLVACLPSLVAVTQSEAHNQTLAAQVTNNFRGLSTQILTTPSLAPRAIRKRYGPKKAEEVNGKISEIGVLGHIWRGILYGYWDDETYALPTTKWQDSGAQQKDGRSLSADIVVRRSDTRDKQLVQVKTSRSRERYHDEVVVVEVSYLMDGYEADNPRRLLGHLQAKGHNKHSQRIQTRLAVPFHQAAKRVQRQERTA